MNDYTIYHNPRCSKSRETLTLLEQSGATPRIVEYLKTPPTAAELKAIVAKLGIEPEQLVRKGEDVYKSEYAGKQLDRRAMDRRDGEHPVLIERPIVIKGEQAILGRPPENVKKLLR